MLGDSSYHISSYIFLTHDNRAYGFTLLKWLNFGVTTESISGSKVWQTRPSAGSDSRSSSPNPIIPHKSCYKIAPCSIAQYIVYWNSHNWWLCRFEWTWANMIPNCGLQKSQTCIFLCLPCMTHQRNFSRLNLVRQAISFSWAFSFCQEMVVVAIHVLPPSRFWRFGIITVGEKSLYKEPSFILIQGMLQLEVPLYLNILSIFQKHASVNLTMWASLLTLEVCNPIMEM